MSQYLTPTQLEQVGQWFVERGLVALARETLDHDPATDEVHLTCIAKRDGTTSVEVEYRKGGFPINGWGA